MARYLLRRAGLMVVMVFLALLLNFLIPRAMPGDPVELQLQRLASGGGQVGDTAAMAAEMRAHLGLDQPVWRQFVSFLGNTARLDLGVSVANYPERVADTIRSGLPWTMGLLGAATVISFALGTLLGGLLAWPGSGRLVR